MCVALVLSTAQPAASIEVEPAPLAVGPWVAAGWAEGVAALDYSGERVETQATAAAT